MRTSVRVGAIVRILGRLVLIEALLMLLPLAVCLIYGESDWRGFAVAVGAAALTGGVAELSVRRRGTSIRSREGFIITALVWVVFGLFGMLPFMLSATPLGFTDAMFEVISGFTTTGASMITDVEAQSHGILFWRAFTQWIGGLGIIFFMLAVLPELNKATGISMFNAEATGITHGKLHPRIRQTALSIWGVYASLTVVSILLLWGGPMNLFDSICQTFAAIATGGFTTRNDGIAYWHSDYAMIVLTVVMFVAGLNFMLLYSVWRKNIREFIGNDVLKAFTGVVVVVYLLFLVSALLRGEEMTLDNLLVYPLFHIVSAVTSTGFSITGAEGWGPFALFLTMLLMTCGACSGSTSGGIKIDRVAVMWRNFINEIRKTVFPKRTYVVSINGSALHNSLVSRISAFVSLYLLTIVVASAVVTLFGYELTDSLFMVISCIGCNGLGYGVTGAEGSFALLPAAVKWMLVWVMLVGRLELFTFLVLLLPSFWKR
ncbi:MAG: TrkH family potassium uptake protein [Muribaculaceae bacterium]|nr:TrkH family potassium uptake protein [Muribaculaceae bacterium]